jgi:sugar phosphate isomerase/epimerase
MVPAGKTGAVQDFWSHCEEVTELGVHHIEFNNTRMRIAEAYLQRVSEFQDRMMSQGLAVSGIAQFSHMDRQSEFSEILQQHLLLGEFLFKIGGKYITHMIAPASVLNEVDDEKAYQRIDLKTWVKNANEVGRQVFERWGVKVAYHPEQREVIHGVFHEFLHSTDERYVHFLADTGHLAAGGADPIAVCSRYHKRLVAVHLKDFSPQPDLKSSAKAGNVAFGKGVVALPALIARLRANRFAGWVMGESGGSDVLMYQYMTETLRLSF